MEKSVHVPAVAGKGIDLAGLSTEEALRVVADTLNEIMEQLEDLLPSRRDNDVEPLTEPGAGPLSPPIALLSDGRIALSIEDLEGVDLSEREVFNGIVLTEDEASDVLDYMAGGIADAAARVGGDLLQRHPKKGGGESGSSEGGVP